MSPKELDFQQSLDFIILKGECTLLQIRFKTVRKMLKDKSRFPYAIHAVIILFDFHVKKCGEGDIKGLFFLVKWRHYTTQYHNTSPHSNELIWVIFPQQKDHKVEVSSSCKRGRSNARNFTFVIIILRW